MEEIPGSGAWQILVIDDDEDDYLLVRTMLARTRKNKCHVTWAPTYDEARQLLDDHLYDAVLMDYDLGAHSGIELIREASANECPVPFILFTGRGSYEIDMEAMQAGASLYLTKGETSDLMLERGIRYAIERKNNQMMLAQNETALRDVNEELSQELIRRERTEEELQEKSTKLEELLYRQRVISEAAADLLAGANPLEQLTSFFQKFSESLGLEVYLQYNVAPDGSHLVLNSIGGIPEKYLPTVVKLDFGQAVCGTVAQQRKPIYINNVQQSKDPMVRLIRTLGIGTYACHPLIVNGELLGTLSFGSVKFDHFEADTIDLLKTFCNLVAHSFGRTRGEQALRKSEENFKTLANNMAQMSWMADPTGSRTWFNQRWYEYTGCTFAEGQGWGWKRVIHPDHLSRVEELIEKSTEAGSAWEGTYPIKGAHGEWRWFLTRSVPVRNQTGEIVRWFGTNTDITERLEAEEAMREKQAQLLEAYEELQVSSEEIAATNEEMLAYASKIEKAHEVTEEHKRRLEAVMDALPVGITITDSKGKSILVNPAFEQIWGGSPRKFNSMKDFHYFKGWWADTHQPITPEEWASAQVLTKGIPVHRQIIKIQRFDGKRVYALNSASPIIDPKGRVIGSAVAIQDINPLKQSEILNVMLNDLNQVLYSSQKFEGVIQQILKLSSYALGCDTAVVSLRKGSSWVVSYVHGYSEEVVGAVMDDDEERHAVLAIQTQEPVAVSNAFEDERFNTQHMKKWGIRSVLVVPLLAKGDTEGVIFFNYQASRMDFEDYHLQFGRNLAASLSLALENQRLVSSLEAEIQEKQIAEEQLRSSEQRWVTTLSSIGDAVIATDSQGRITFMNRIAEELTGWNFSEAFSQDIQQVFQIVKEDTHEPVESPVDSVINNETIVGLTNHTILIKKDGTEIPIDDRGAPIQDENGDLLGAVLIFRDISDRRKNEIYLQNYSKRLEKSNKELEEFAMITSHDLQEPLRKIKSFARYIDEHSAGKLDETDRDYLKRMVSASQRMGKMIEDLLLLSRVTSRGHPFQQVDLNKVLSAVLEDLQDRVVSAQAQVTIAPLPAVQADASQMHQLFLNLVGNAVKFKKKQVKPIVEIGCTTMPDGMVEITVKDNGIGFDMKHAGKLFQPFQRLHGRSDYEGTGIGLSICRKIVERHAGDISVQSEPEVGSTFTVILPINQK